MKHKGYSYFLASESDLFDLSRLMELSTRVLQKPFLNNQQIEASFEAMGIDKELVRDQTYFKVLKGATLIGGCCGSSPSHIRFLKSKMNKFKFYKY